MPQYDPADYINPLTDETIQQLYLLARGDFDLVEQAVMGALEEVCPQWWKIWGQREWRINLKKATDYIMERRNEIENIPLADDIND